MEKIAAYRFLFFHVFFLIALYFLMHLIGLCSVFPSNTSLMQWDANWYQSIQLNGYSYSDKIQSNAGFFPLFPLFWKLLGVGPLLISVVNALICLSSIVFLMNNFQLDSKYLLLFLSLPSIFFLYVPYAEGLFFLSSALILVGLKKDKNAWIITGIVLASMCKATAIFFIPAGLFMLLTQQPLKQINLYSFCTKSVLLMAAVVAGTMLVVLIQYDQTGVWFAYFKAQSMHWNRSFSLPVFPLTTWDAKRLLSLDAASFLLGVVALFLCMSYFWNSLRNNSNSFLRLDKAYLFSCAFLVMVLGSILFFNPIDGATNSTSILSINRYMIASPFLLIFLQHHFTSSRLTQKELLLVIGVLIAAGFLFSAYSGKKSAFQFFLLIGYLTTYLFVLYKPSSKKYWLVLYLLNCCLQAILFNSFLEGMWVG